MIFRDDTGASGPFFTLDDIYELEATCGIKPQHMGTEIVKQLYAEFLTHRFVLEVRVVEQGLSNKPLTRWVNLVFFAVKPDKGHYYNSNGQPVLQTAVDPVAQRLSGSWWRHMLYTATAPDNRRELYTGTTKDELEQLLPSVDFNLAKAPGVPVGFLPLGSQAELKLPIAEGRKFKQPKYALDDEAEGTWREGHQPVGLHPPTYLQYIDMIEKENEGKPPNEIKTPTVDTWEQDRLNQAYWTTETGRRVQPPTWEQYCQWLKRRDRAFASSAWGVRLVSSREDPSEQGFKRFKADQRNWVSQPENGDEEGCSLM